MQSIKISKKTKKEIEKKQAEILLDTNKKVTQSELLEKIVEKAISDNNFIDELFSDEDHVIIPKKKEVEIVIEHKIKAIPRFFKDEWED